MVPIIPERLSNLKGVLVLVVSGRYDPIIPADEAEQLVTMLRKCGPEASVSVRGRRAWVDRGNGGNC